MNDIISELISYASGLEMLEFAGMIFGLLAVYYLIKENIFTWPAGIIYVLISFVIFFNAKLYADLFLHIVYLVLNLYGWYFWKYGNKKKDEKLPVTTDKNSNLTLLSILSLVGIAIMGYSLKNFSDASLPYWDSATTILSFTGMWLTARKKIESWYFWFVVDVIATIVYIYKGIYFYSFLYCIYIGMAISGYVNWKKSMELKGKLISG